MTMNDNPKPKPPPAKPQPMKEAPVKVLVGSSESKERPKYVQKPHLTERPFKDHAGLVEMRKKLESTNRSQSRTTKEKK